MHRSILFTGNHRGVCEKKVSFHSDNLNDTFAQKLDLFSTEGSLDVDLKS